ncbi:secretory subunit [Mycoemilia scoparia]|uniref:Secretory subunit n=1 Tax=Mycoemilia scoparia TaxID=417184 RepID=A0A9W7ZWF2_9FUNG|nr:secretory subunit [Mycoemilia scoparia]
MARYTYDESGVTFYYFALTIIGLVTVPATLALFVFKGRPDAASQAPKTIKLRKKKVHSASRAPQIKLALIGLGWALIAILAYQVKVTPVQTTQTWDPYEILGIDSGSDMGQVKKAFRLLSLKWHPDKVSEDLREEAEGKYVDISKAYKTLTDDVARENYEKYGHPDGLQTTTMGIALPKWLVEAHASPFVLGIYCLVFGFIMPFYVGRWWYRSSRFTKDGILHPTMATFFKNIRENISQRNLIEIITSAHEFKTDELKYKPSEEADLESLATQVKNVISSEGNFTFKRSEKFPDADTWKANILLNAHLYRVTVTNPDLANQQLLMVETTIHLIQKGLLQIATAHSWTSCSLNIMRLSQWFVQGVGDDGAPFLQLPFIERKPYKLLRNSSDIYSINQFNDLKLTAKKRLINWLEPTEIDKVIETAEKIPKLEISRSFLTVIGDKIITPLAIVTLVVKLRITNPHSDGGKPSVTKDPLLDIESIDENDPEAVEEFLNKVESRSSDNGTTPEAISPQFSSRKGSSWWVSFSSPQSNRFIFSPIRVNDLVSEKIITMQFQAPPKTGDVNFMLSVLSDSYIGADQHLPITLKVVERSQLPPEPVVEDDISEPEEDSIAGQMAQMRKQGLSGGAQNADDTSDEE